MLGHTSFSVCFFSCLMLTACDSGGGSPEGCVSGETQSCACFDGREGAQVCTPAGVFAECVCGDPGGPARTGGEDSDPSPDPDPPEEGGCSFNTDCGAAEICIVGECREMWDRTYSITVVEARLYERDQNGAAWDSLSGAPDMYVSVLIDGSSIGVTRTRQDTYSPTWNQAFDARLFRDTEVSFYFVDEDPFASDGVLNLRLFNLQASIQGGGGSWENDENRGVASFVYFIEPR